MLNIDEVAEMNVLFNNQKKEVESRKKEIKDYAKNTEMEIEGKKWKAVLKNSTKETLNQERTIKKLKELGALWLIKQIEVVDEHELEDAIATGELEGKEFANCVDTTNTLKLTFVKKKG